MRNGFLWSIISLSIAFGLLTASAFAQSPLHQQIDLAIAAKAGGKVSPPADDAEFLRRVYLDLAGIVPTAKEARQFLADKDPAKRQKLIDKLLAGEHYPRRMQQYFSVMLLERRNGKNIADKEWEKYLQTAFAQNKPWDLMVKDLLATVGMAQEARPAMKFSLVRGASHSTIALDVNRLFLGRNMECAQCHDHPSIDDYKQSEFFGVLAFLKDSYLHKDKKTGQTFFAEKGMAMPVEFTSVFTGEISKTGPRVPGAKEIKIPTFPKGEELAAKAEEGKPPIPKFPLRVKLVDQLTAAENVAFRRNIANRLWAMMMGRGLIHPLDMMHENNPPSHPQLLDALAKELAAHKFDIKWFLRELALSQTYQRSSMLPDGMENTPVESYVAANLKSLSAEQITWSVMRATGHLEQVLAVPADEAATAKYRPDKGYPLPSENLDNVTKLFRSVYASQPGQPEEGFAPSAAAALFMTHETLLLKWLKPQAGNLMDRLLKLPNEKAIAEELYLTLFTRFPSAEESAETIAYLKENAGKKQAALAKLAWAMLASAEFRLNH